VAVRLNEAVSSGRSSESNPGLMTQQVKAERRDLPYPSVVVPLIELDGFAATATAHFLVTIHQCPDGGWIRKFAASQPVTCFFESRLEHVDGV
jgi:hypothetical protein